MPLPSIPNATVSVVTGAWAVPLFRSNRNFADIRQQAAKLQKVEAEHLVLLRHSWTRARVRIWNLAEFVENPMEPLQNIVDEIAPRTLRRLTEAPVLTDFTGFGQFLQNLRNQGMQPTLTGDFPVSNDPNPAALRGRASLSGEVMPHFRSFVLFAEMRTGSNFLESNLNAMPGVTCHGEVFNPHFIGRLNQTELMGIDLAARDRDPALMLARLRERSEGLSGFRYFHDHDARILPLVLEDPACAKIVLTRNPVESYVSRKIAQATGQWKLTQAHRLRAAKGHFEAAEFEAHLEALQTFQISLLHALQISGQTAFYLDYEDLFDLGVLNGLARFLGVEGLAALDGALKKQNPEPLEDKVGNWAEMAAALARLDRFDLSRTPNFEPRRAPANPVVSGRRAAPLHAGPRRAGSARDRLARRARPGRGRIRPEVVASVATPHRTASQLYRAAPSRRPRLRRFCRRDPDRRPPKDRGRLLTRAEGPVAEAGPAAFARGSPRRVPRLPALLQGLRRGADRPSGGRAFCQPDGGDPGLCAVSGPGHRAARGSSGRGASIPCGRNRN